jgi:hypothetical protein
MKRSLFLLACAVLLTAAKPPPPVVSDKERSRVDEGKVAVISDHDRSSGDSTVATVTGLVEIAAPVERIWEILLSRQHLVDSSGVVKSVVHYGETSDDGDHYSFGLKFELKVMFSTMEYWVRRDLHRKDGYLTWLIDSKQPNDLKHSEGSYSVFKSPNEGRLWLVYRAQIQSGKAIPAWLEEDLTEGSLKTYLAYVKEHAEAPNRD